MTSLNKSIIVLASEISGNGQGCKYHVNGQGCKYHVLSKD
ncbi:MAG: hypothetical protein H6R00_1674 [Proteobacteria bacterium]|nr:hypothetical protein [Pseudomonadota bacterium]